MAVEAKDWDSWKKHDHYLARAIHRNGAEYEQLQRTKDDSWYGNDTLHFRGEFLGIIAPEYVAELKLHSEANPHVTIKDKDRKLVAIITLGGMMSGE